MNKFYDHTSNEDILFVQYMLYIFHTIVMHCRQQVQTDSVFVLFRHLIFLEVLISGDTVMMPTSSCPESNHQLAQFWIRQNTGSSNQKCDLALNVILLKESALLSEEILPNSA